MSLVDLLCDDKDENNLQTDYSVEEKYLVECYRESDSKLKNNIISILKTLRMITKNSEYNVRVVNSM